jgi:peptidoglycan/LPS O-acetylase OafA/YrhL
VGGRVTNLLDRIGVPPFAIVPLSCAVSVGAAWLFYVNVEKRTLKARPALTDPKAPVAVAA